MGDEEEKIKVVVRVRDLIGRERDQLKAFTTQDSADVIQKNTKKSWSFDRVFGPLDNNRTVYIDTASDIIEQTVSGFNTTIFAYGQTSSGKTHTMYGTASETGVIGMAVEQLFYAVEETPDRRFLMNVSYMEIYNEMVNDLLCDAKSRPAGGLKVRENEEGFYVEDLIQKTVTSAEEIHRFMKIGDRSRHTGRTNMNEKSSRSHTIFRITLESTNRLNDTDDNVEDAEEGRQVTVAQLNLVDLAGSEKAAQTGAGGIRLKEGCNINNSLMVLGQVIQKLSSGEKGHINFRDSNLTKILQNSIGGNAKTAIICTVTPAAMSEDQTISTLRFASQAKTIKNHAKVNEVLDDQAEINRLKKEMAKLLNELEQHKNAANKENVQEVKEQLEKERMEKEEYLKKIRELQEKVITSSQPAPPRKSLMKKSIRRETWCGPAMRKNMRMSLAPHKFVKPLCSVGYPVFADDPRLSQPESLDNISVTSADFNLSSSVVKEQFESIESEKLKELDLIDIEDETVFEEDESSPCGRKRSVRFVESPQFFSPRQKKVDLNITDNGTPKAVIRDKFKRVSIALSSREVELDKERQIRLELEREHKELQEFTRLESESGVDEERKSLSSEGAELDLSTKLKFFEKSYYDVEKLNLDLNKELSERKQECGELRVMHEETMKKMNILAMKDKENAGLSEQLSVLLKEIKELKDKNFELENHKTDFDMRFELEMKKKEAIITDLRKYLDSAYEEIATAESCEKSSVTGRVRKTKELKEQVDKLEIENTRSGKLMEELEAENESLKEGMVVVTAEMEKLSEDKIALEDEVKSMKEQIGDAHHATVLEKEMEHARLEEVIKAKSDEISNLELSNASLLETVDNLSRKVDEVTQSNSEVLVSSAEVNRFNVELKEEIGQLKAEVKSANDLKDALQVEKEELRLLLDEAGTSRADLVELIKSEYSDEIEALKKELQVKVDENVKMESMIKSDERSTLLTKLSLTLNNIDESFICTEDNNVTCTEESPVNTTCASNTNTTFNVPLEVVEMKNQLLCLQQQLISFSPEESERKEKEISELKLQNTHLSKNVNEILEEKIRADEIISKYEKMLEEQEQNLKAKHEAEIAIVSTKMQEEINVNIPALEERLKEEYEERYQKLSSSASRFQYELKIKENELKECRVKLAQAELGFKSDEGAANGVESFSSHQNTTLGIMPKCTESLYTTACEDNFDNILGSGSMNITMENTVFSPELGDSLQVQMLKGELEVLKNALQEKDELLARLKNSGSSVSELDEDGKIFPEGRKSSVTTMDNEASTVHIAENLVDSEMVVKQKEVQERENTLHVTNIELRNQLVKYEDLNAQQDLHISEIALKSNLLEENVDKISIKLHDVNLELSEKNAQIEVHLEELKRKDVELLKTREDLTKRTSECVVLQENLQEKIEEKSRIEAILQSKTEELSASLKDKNLEILLEDEKKILIQQKAEVVEDLNMLKKELEEKNAKISSIEAGMENITADLENVIIEKENAFEKVSALEAIIEEQTEEKIKILKLVQSKSEESSATEKANSVLLQQKADDENLWMSKMKDEQEKNNEMNIVLQNKIEEVLAAEVEKNILIQEKTEADRNLEVVKAEQEHERKQLSKLKDDLDRIKIDLRCAINEKEDAVKTVCAKEAIILELKSNADKIKDLDLLKAEQEFRNAKISSLEEGMENIMTDLENVNIEKENALEKVKAQEAIIQEQTEEKAEILKLLQSKAEELCLSEKAKCVLQQKVDDESQWMLKMKDEQEKNDKMNFELQNKIEEVVAAEAEKNILMQEKTEAVKNLEVVKEEQEQERKQCTILKHDIENLKIELQYAINQKEDTVRTLCANEAIIQELKRRVDKVQILEKEVSLLNSKLADASAKLVEAKEKQDIFDDRGKQIERLKFDLQEAERLRDIVDAECDRLESELEETKVKLVEINTTQDVKGQQPSSLQSTMMSGQHTLLNNVSMDCTFIPAPDLRAKLQDIEFEKEELLRELNDVKRQLASSPTEEKYLYLKSQLIKQKEYNDKIFEENKDLRSRLIKSEEAVASIDTIALQKKLTDVKQELGLKNIEYASLKVDVEKGELEYKRKCEVLQADLEYEKANSQRLTQEIRRYQTSAMDTTVIQPKTQPKKHAEVSTPACHTSETSVGSPVWSSGSGAIKEIRLHNAEMRVKTLEKENSKLKEHEEFYINKAREWKSRALKYEKTMEHHGVVVPGKENRREIVASANAGYTRIENPDPVIPASDPETVKIYEAAGLSPRTNANPLQDLQNLRTEAGAAPPTPTEDIKLVLSRRSEPRRTEADFRLPEDQARKKVDDCKTQ